MHPYGMHGAQNRQRNAEPFNETPLGVGPFNEAPNPCEACPCEACEACLCEACEACSCEAYGMHGTVNRLATCRTHVGPVRPVRPVKPVRPVPVNPARLPASLFGSCCGLSFCSLQASSLMPFYLKQWGLMLVSLGRQPKCHTILG